MDNSNEGPASKRLKKHHDLHETLVLRPCDSKPRVGWNSLPAELRLEIYYYLIPRFDHAINVSYPKFENRFFREYNESISNNASDEEKANRLPWTKILLINKQISYECLDILYGKNSFQIEMQDTGEADLRANFTQENRQRMRYVTIGFLGTEGATFPPGNSLPDYDLWAGILPTVRELWIVLVQPFRPFTPEQVGHEDFLVGELANRFDQYLEWLPPYCACFNELLDPQTAVYIMSSRDEQESQQVVSEYFIWW